MTQKKIYYCFRDPKNQNIIEQNEILLGDKSPYDIINQRFENCFASILPSMKPHEKKTLEYYYATDIIRPLQGIATVEKGPFKVERGILGSSAPGHIEILPYQYGLENQEAASPANFPFPKSPSLLLHKDRFYNDELVKDAIKKTISLLEQALASDFSSNSQAELLTQTDKLTSICGGASFCPHPAPFSSPTAEESATTILDVVILALAEKNLVKSLPNEALELHKNRLEMDQQKENSILLILNAIKSGNL